ncbi:MAG: WYL domain-containing protein [Schwartzia sp.]|nr:WYL domain-containing protein [Schwartzia sp. (in: firmicutes)]
MLDIYERLSKGEQLNKRQLARDYGVGEKTIQRDFDDIRDYLADKRGQGADATIKYDRAANAYHLTRFAREWLTNQEVLALCKILLDSRALEKGEMKALIEKILAQASPHDRAIAEAIIRGESAAYVPLRHGKKLLSYLWKISVAISGHREISFRYTRQDGASHRRKAKPLSILFSEFYFYMIGLYTSEDGDAYRTYRIDQMKDLKETGETFRVPHREKFSDGEFRKRVQFMYDYEMQHIRFRFFGDSVEHILDRLPTAKAKKLSEGVYDITAEVYGGGILMWLLSQGSRVDVYAPASLRETWLQEARGILARDSDKMV